jgi:hypothetical protein
MATTTQRDLVGTVGRVSRIKVLVTTAASDTASGTHTFSRAFRTTPEVVSVTRVDNVSSVITGRVSSLSATAMALTFASATGSEVFECVIEGELA